MNEQEIINQLVAKAKEAEGISYDSVDGTEKVAADFTKMSDEQIAKFLKSHGMDVGKAALKGIEKYWQILSQIIIDDVAYDTEDHYTADPDWDGYIAHPDERKRKNQVKYKNKKYSSFKEQQAITESFRRFLKK